MPNLKYGWLYLQSFCNRDTNTNRRGPWKGFWKLENPFLWWYIYKMPKENSILLWGTVMLLRPLIMIILLRHDWNLHQLKVAQCKFYFDFNSNKKNIVQVLLKTLWFLSLILGFWAASWDGYALNHNHNLMKF